MQDRELELYLEYFHRLNKQLHKPDKIIFLNVGNVETLLGRIRQRGRAEEGGLDGGFLTGLNAYYSTFPQVCRSKYGMDVLCFDVTAWDIRSGSGRERFLDEVGTFLHS